MHKAVISLDADIVPPGTRTVPQPRGKWAIRLVPPNVPAGNPVEVFITGTPEQLQTWATSLVDIIDRTINGDPDLVPRRDVPT